MAPESFVKQRPALTAEELRPLLYRNPWRSTAGILRLYTLFVVVLAVALWQGGWWLVPAFFLVGALQHGLSILQHEAVHGLLFRNMRLNDFIGAWLLSYPIGFTLRYRATHFAHHRSLGDDAHDPDAVNYRPFPSSPGTFLWAVLCAFSGFGAVIQFFRGNSGSSPAFAPFMGILLTQLVLFSLFALAGHPFFYVLLWLLPLVTFAKGLTSLRNLAEHLLRTHAPAGTERLRTFRSSPLERFFFAPCNFHIHAEHHWYPQVPYYHLPALRRLLQTRPEYALLAEQSPSYLATLRRAMRP